MVNVESFERARYRLAQAPGAATQDRGEIFNMAVQHHQAGRLDEADGLYRLLLEVEPDFADALHRSGLIRLARNHPGEAIELFTRAIAADPGNAAYHGNLGRAHAALDDSDAALASFRRAVELDSNSAESLAGMGQLLHQLERFDEAIECLEQACRVQPGSPESESMLGNAYHAANRLEEAVTHYRRAVEMNPDHAAAHENLGLALFDLGDLQAAVTHARRAVDLQPDTLAAHLNLGWAVFGSGDNSEARKHFEAAIKLAPEMSEAQSKLALCYLAGGDLEDAYEHFKRAAQLAIRPRQSSAPFKLSHDIDQMRHLYARGVAGDDIQRIIGGFESVRDAMPRHTPRDEIFTLNQAQRDKLNPNYDKAYYIPTCPTREASALGNGIDRKLVEKSYFGLRPNLAVVDNLLSPDTLSRLRAFCREATIWKDVGRGYLGAHLEDGFGEPLMLQIAHELRGALPAIFADHPLIDMWSHKYDQQFAGLDKHADRAAVNVNFWISPDDANCDPKSGGLEVFKAEAPAAWNFGRGNNEPEAIERVLDEQGGGSITIPHRSNRAVIFDSNLFHKTGDCQFRSGYINHRTNITMLFGHRHHQ